LTASRDIGDGLVIALGGNSIARTGEKGTIAQQWKHTDQATAEIATLWGSDRRPLVITHGNGPQVGRVLMRSELASKEMDSLPLDVAVADTQAGMGYMIQQLFGNHLARAGQRANTVAVVTRVEVRADDPGFKNPTKPIGTFYTEEEARHLMGRREWASQFQMAEDAGRGWRRVVASPRPIRVVETRAIRDLLEQGDIVIAVGGGGIPVIKVEGGDLVGIECVIDKDLASALLAESLGLRRLVIITGVPSVCLGFGTPDQREVDRMTADEAQAHLDAGEFPPGSMGPKMAAAIGFARHGGTTIITQPGELEAALAGECGTRIVPD
jgi:carbamate kinase